MRFSGLARNRGLARRSFGGILFPASQLAESETDARQQDNAMLAQHVLANGSDRVLNRTHDLRFAAWKSHIDGI